MQKITSKLALCLTLTLALTACKKEESKKETQATSSKSQVPRIGDRCYLGVPLHCDGKDVIYCDYQDTTEGILISSTWKKDTCGNGMECRHIEDGSASGFDDCVKSTKLFTSCDAAMADFWDEIDADSFPEFCTQLYVLPETIYESGAPKCLDAGDGKKTIWRFYKEYCNTCNRQEHTVTCEQDDAIFGKNAKENDVCWRKSFVPRYVENNSALVCTKVPDEFDSVKKVTCPAGREIALVGISAVCIDPNEAECAAHTYKCGTVQDTAASLGDKICLQTDKVKHLLAKEDILDNSVASFYEPVLCGAKGCDQATGTCFEAGPSDFKWCKDGQFGHDCAPCTCKNGQCDDGLYGDGECNSCDKDYYGKNCDKTYGTMTDNKNKKYNTVLINNVEWMAENMATDTATDGSPVTCYANREGGSDFVAKYGCLYSGDEAAKVCPAGWHLPSKEEFEELLEYVANYLDLLSRAWDGFSSDLTDRYGFGALPAGLCTQSYCENRVAHFWGTSIVTEFGERYWNYMRLNRREGKCESLGASDAHYSVRCIKD